MDVGIGLNRLLVQRFGAADVPLLMLEASVLKKRCPVGGGMKGLMRGLLVFLVQTLLSPHSGLYKVLYYPMTGLLSSIRSSGSS